MVADNVVIKTGLPGEIDIMHCCIFFDPNFKSANYRRQVF